MTDWEACYQKNEYPWDKGEPSPGLVDFLKTESSLEKGRVCVPGCGLGHDVREWARHGFDATGFDISTTAMDMAAAKTEGRLPARFESGNFLTETPRKPFDWVFEHTLFCAIQPSERDQYVQAAARWLRPGGQYLAVYYLITDPDGPPFPSTREEILERFSGTFDLKREWTPRSYPNRTNLELMVWWTLKP